MLNINGNSGNTFNFLSQGHLIVVNSQTIWSMFKNFLSNKGLIRRITFKTKYLNVYLKNKTFLILIHRKVYQPRKLNRKKNIIFKNNSLFSKIIRIVFIFIPVCFFI